MNKTSRKKSGDSKTLPLRNAARRISAFKSKGLKTVLCHGVYDLVHPGHIRHLQAAKREGDILIVTVTPDRFVGKGPGRPVFNQTLRAEHLAALECVDFVAINEWPTAVETIRLLRPHVYVKGKDYADREGDITGKIRDEERAVKAVGGRIHFTDDIVFSSSHLLNTHFGGFPPETEAWLKDFRNRHTAEEIIGTLDRTRRLKALVVGEAIVDEYAFCDGLGKSTKDPILAFNFRSLERYAGGSLAVANHLAGLCEEVGLITILGERERSEDFIRSALRPNVKPIFLTQRGAPTIHKRRFVDTHTGARILELYVMEDRLPAPQLDRELCGALSKLCRRYDLVVASDYGHGLSSPSVVSTLCGKARFLAVCTQANAGNRGFNTISKYPRADYVCLAMHEVALETRMRPAKPHELALEIAKRINGRKFTITQGKYKSIHFTKGRAFTEVPALATRITDRVGAGDAVLAVTAPLAALDVPWDILGFIGNVAGAQMVAELGNRTTVDRLSLSRHITALLK